jgi:hypothetical protein
MLSTIYWQRSAAVESELLSGVGIREVRNDALVSHNHMDALSDLYPLASSDRKAAASDDSLCCSFCGRLNMTQVYFHCSNTKKILVDRRGAVVDDLAQAREHAAGLVRSLTKERSLEDWRDWVLHVSDDLGDDPSP